MSEPTLYRIDLDHEHFRWAAGLPEWLVPVDVESADLVKIRWCQNHRRETWGGRTTCPGRGSADLCDVVDARLIISKEEQ